MLTVHNLLSIQHMMIFKHTHTVKYQVDSQCDDIMHGCWVQIDKRYIIYTLTYFTYGDCAFSV